MLKTETKSFITKAGVDCYSTSEGFTVTLEQGTLTPTGNPIGDSWVLRDPNGVFIDFDQYRHDLFERNGFTTY